MEVSFASRILLALPYFIRLETDYLKTIDQQQSLKEGVNVTKTFDFIVVGGGTAGCVVAGRLSQHFNVLLLEAGGSPPMATVVPAFRDFLVDAPDLSYFYKTIPQKNANFRVLDDRMGRGLGGSGSHNALIYSRGNAYDYDTWANLTKDPTWSYESLLKIFRNIETYNGYWPRTRQHGLHGAITVETSTRPIYPIWKEALEELGYNEMDPNGPQTEGFSQLEFSRENGRRASTYTTYLRPFLNRKTLTIVKYAFAHQILFSGSRAIGVEYEKYGVKLQAFASKEVITSAGAYSSPLLLQKSGIAPRDLLAQAGIPLRLDLPVGLNLQNHHGLNLGPFKIKDHSKLSCVNNNLTEEHFEQYLSNAREIVLSETGSGPQLLMTSAEAKKKGELDWPDIRISFHGIANSKTGRPFELPLAVTITRPEFNLKFTGSVKLNHTAYKQGSTDNAELAMIDYKFLESEYDYTVLRDGITTAVTIMDSKAFKSVGTSYGKDAGCHFGSSDYWKCYINKHGISWLHPAGTCRMSYGRGDVNSVVDSKLRVHGIDGLRVVDASVMPYVTNSNTNAPVVLIAEKAVVEIFSDYKVNSNFK